ncbi:uncharacterized protein LOC142354941 isoform X2 [Convolutriloba macropyga]
MTKTAEQKIMELYDSCLNSDLDVKRNKAKSEKVKFDDFGFIEFGRGQSSSGEDSGEIEEMRYKEEKRSRVMRQKLAKLEREEMKKKGEDMGAFGGSLSARIRKSKRFRRWSYKGFPIGFRGELYSALACSAYFSRIDEANHIYERVLAFGRSSGSSHNDTFIKQIDADIHRTLRKHSFFSERYNSRQRELFNILVAYAVFNQSVGYCQGLNLLAAILLIYLKQEVPTFWALHWLVTESLNSHSGFLKPGFPKYQRFEDQFRIALRILLPDVYENLEMQHMPYSAFLPKWFFLIFLEALPFPEAIRAFDIFMMRGHIALIPFSIAIMKHYRKHLSKLSMENLVTFLLEAVPVLGMDDEELFRDFKKVFKRMKKSSLCLPPMDYSPEEPGTPESFYSRSVLEQLLPKETTSTSDQFVDASGSEEEDTTVAGPEITDEAKERASGEESADITSLIPAVPTIQVSDHNNQSISFDHTIQTDQRRSANPSDTSQVTAHQTSGQGCKPDCQNALEATKRSIERAFRQSLQERASPIAELSTVLRHALASPKPQSIKPGFSILSVRNSEQHTVGDENERGGVFGEKGTSTCSDDVMQESQAEINRRSVRYHRDGSASDTSLESDQPVDLFSSVHELLIEDQKERHEEKKTGAGTSSETTMTQQTPLFIDVDAEGSTAKRSKSQLISSLSLPKQICTRSMSETSLKITQIHALLSQTLDYTNTSSTTPSSPFRVWAKIEQATSHSQQARSSTSTPEPQSTTSPSTLHATHYVVNLEKASFNSNLISFLIKRTADNNSTAAAGGRWSQVCAVNRFLLSSAQRSFSCVNSSNLNLPLSLSHLVNHSDHINSLKRFNTCHVTQLIRSQQAHLAKLTPLQLNSPATNSALKYASTSVTTYHESANTETEENTGRTDSNSNTHL